MPILGRSSSHPLGGEAVQVVARNWTPAELLARRDREDGAAWADGDELTFVYEGQAGEVQICCGIQQPMQRVGDGDLWALTVRIRDLPRAAIRYAFFPDPGRQPAEMSEWRGPQAPPPVARAEPLQGQIRRHTLDSTALGERRGLTIYLPPNHDPRRTWPVVYAADGQSVPGLAATLEPLIAGGTVPAVLLVGVHAAEAPASAPALPGQDSRAQEYLPGVNAKRFAAHARFFVEEAAAWAEGELGASARREERAVFGYSNGGVFAAALGLRHPERFGCVLAFSVGVSPVERRAAFPAQAPAFYLLAGTLEEGFHRGTTAFAGWLRSGGAAVEFHERVCGHDLLMWEEAFPQAVGWAFG